MLVRVLVLVLLRSVLSDGVMSLLRFLSICLPCPWETEEGQAPEHGENKSFRTFRKRSLRNIDESRRQLASGSGVQLLQWARTCDVRRDLTEKKKRWEIHPRCKHASRCLWNSSSNLNPLLYSSLTLLLPSCAALNQVRNTIGPPIENHGARCCWLHCCGSRLSLPRYSIVVELRVLRLFFLVSHPDAVILPGCRVECYASETSDRRYGHLVGSAPARTSVRLRLFHQ